MRTIKLTFFIWVMLLCQLQAQNYTGVSESQYAGYLGLNINPANVVNKNYRFDFTFTSWNFSLANDYIDISWDSLILGQGDFFDRFEDINNNSNYANLALDLEINWFGGMFRINDKMGAGFGIKTRSLLSATGFNKDLLKMSAASLEDISYYGQAFKDDVLTLSLMSWNEYKVTFGSEVFNTGKHYVKVGGSLKLLQSVGSFYLQAKDIAYEFYNADTIVSLSGEITYGGNFTDVPFGAGSTFLTNPFGGSDFGFGADVGAVYEFRPKEDDEYKLKVGLSFQDIGFVAFKPEPAISNTITFNNSILDVKAFDGINSLDDINGIINQDTAQFDATFNESTYLMQIPTKMNLFADYNVIKGFYVSFFSEISLYNARNPHRVAGINSFELTPRYDFKWFGFSLPISYVQYSGFNLGLGFRIGPFYAGSSNIIDLFQAGTKVSRVNAYFGFRVPIHKK